MKTQIKIAAFIILGVAVLFFCSFKAEKKLKVELSQKQWEAILNQLDNSASPHNEIKITTSWIIEQLRPQVMDTTTKK
jgi:hypothetical protein